MDYRVTLVQPCRQNRVLPLCGPCSYPEQRGSSTIERSPMYDLQWLNTCTCLQPEQVASFSDICTRKDDFTVLTDRV